MDVAELELNGTGLAKTAIGVSRVEVMKDPGGNQFNCLHTIAANPPASQLR